MRKLRASFPPTETLADWIRHPLSTLSCHVRKDAANGARKTIQQPESSGQVFFLLAIFTSGSVADTDQNGRQCHWHHQT